MAVVDVDGGGLCGWRWLIWMAVVNMNVGG